MPKKIQFYPLDVTYKIIDDKPVIFLYGVDMQGNQLCVMDGQFEPYFYVLPKKGVLIEDKLLALAVEQEHHLAKVIRVEQVLKKINGREVQILKVFTHHPKDVPVIKDAISLWNMIEAVYEYDILFVRRYLIDKQIIPMVIVDAVVESANQRLRIPSYNALSIEQVGNETYMQPKVLAIDIETYNPDGLLLDPEKYSILMIAFSSGNIEKVFTWKRFKTDNPSIEFVQSEEDLIKRSIDFIKEHKPDIITGYYSDGFDLPYFLARARKYKIKVELGHDFSEPRISTRGEKSCQIEGIVHVDVLKFIRKIFSQELELDSYKMDDVAQELLHEKKHDIDVAFLAQAWDHHPELLEAYCNYNLHDAQLAFRLFEKIFPNLLEMVKIVGLPMFDINRMAYSQLVEWYILRQAQSHKEVAPNKPSHDEIRARKAISYPGAFVFQPEPGFYKDIIVYDFKSLYPSIITSHNIGLSNFRCACCEGKTKVPFDDDTNYWFCTKKRGFIPSIIEELVMRRKRIKEVLLEKKDNPLLNARQNSLKLLANAFYGYLGFAMARWYCIECSRSITAYARDYIKQTIQKVNEAHFSTVYGDTDSVFFTLNGQPKGHAVALLQKINDGLPGILELELEGYYPRGLFVSVKESNLGAKKKYALINEKGALKVRGFETVRRNWSIVGKRVQQEVLNIILIEENPEKAFNKVREVINELRSGTISKKEVIITTQLTKEINSYDSVMPHVAIAQKMQGKNMSVSPGMNISYIITRGSGRLRDRAKLPDEISDGEYDPEYYINNQVVPAVDKILEVFGYKKEDIAANKEQSKLASFF